MRAAPDILQRNRTRSAQCFACEHRETVQGTQDALAGTIPANLDHSLKRRIGIVWRSDGHRKQANHRQVMCWQPGPLRGAFHYPATPNFPNSPLSIPIWDPLAQQTALARDLSRRYGLTVSDSPAPALPLKRSMLSCVLAGRFALSVLAAASQTFRRRYRTGSLMVYHTAQKWGMRVFLYIRMYIFQTIGSV